MLSLGAVFLDEDACSPNHQCASSISTVSTDVYVPPAVMRLSQLLQEIALKLDEAAEGIHKELKNEKQK